MPFIVFFYNFIFLISSAALASCWEIPKNVGLIFMGFNKDELGEFHEIFNQQVARPVFDFFKSQ